MCGDHRERFCSHRRTVRDGAAALATGLAPRAAGGITTRPSALPDGTVPQDVDGDGIYEDLDGNAAFDSDDVVTHFRQIDSDAIQHSADAYDANGNGNADFDDIVTLFEGL